MKQHMLVAVTATALLSTSAVLAEPDNWPKRAVTIVVAYPPGGDTDNVARIYAEQLTQRLKQPFIVENKPGASGMIGAAYVAKAAPDGYTFLHVPSTFAIAPHVVKVDPPLNAVKDFTPVFQHSKAPLVMFTAPSTGIKAVAELVERAKKSSNFSYGSPGYGSPMHLVAEQFNKAAGVELAHVPYKGSAPVITDTLGGHVTVGWTSPASTNQHFNGGTLIPLAVTTAERSDMLPNVPTSRSVRIRGRSELARRADRKNQGRHGEVGPDYRKRGAQVLLSVI